MYDVSKLVPKSTFKFLCEILPTPRQKKRGRRRCEKENLINGILQVLVNGVSWYKIAECGASGVSCWRYFRECQTRGKFKVIFKMISNGITDISECASDTDTIPSFRFCHLVGWSGKHKENGTYISLLDMFLNSKLY